MGVDRFLRDRLFHPAVVGFHWIFVYLFLSSLGLRQSGKWNLNPRLSKLFPGLKVFVVGRACLLFFIFNPLFSKKLWSAVSRFLACCQENFPKIKISSAYLVQNIRTDGCIRL